MKKYEETSLHSSRRLKKVKRNISCDNEVSTAAGPSRKEKKFVKKVVDEVVSDPVILDLSPDDRLCRMDRDRLHTEAAATSSLSGGVDVNDLQENSSGPDARLCNQNRAMNGSSDGIEQITDSNQIEDPQTVEQTSIDLCSSDGKFIDGDQVDNVAGSPISNEWSCVICFEDFSSTLGVLPCEHTFCLTCIQKWAHQRISMGKISTCPLCKASFAWYKIVEHAATADKELNSQTVPCDNLASVTFISMDQELPDNSFEDGACVVCRTRGPDDLIETCNVCWTRRIHSYCMDPPTYPWKWNKNCHGKSLYGEVKCLKRHDWCTNLSLPSKECVLRDLAALNHRSIRLSAPLWQS
ncbi:uncharacterized protein LOC130739328 [Lotus japonicus]|uniref:uncharacterized protein LOC130739328 n=1 Tax=Lotus japonicus TaxID=34305 RepID=UPI002588CC85|nr:uncharacterized protein LOC130739328 [Lotus japonicus]